ncbi:MAG: hypothetical protein JST54_28315 [Deltaproteobacteria bacterium]|nr:hypothetical protein [Deltaproteobacteria bacterium]
MPKRSDFAYAARYCEENVWKLLEHPSQPGEARSAVFITNEDRACLLFRQRASEVPDEPVVWDYHVVLLVEGARAQIWDLDTTLEFPCDAERWLSETFPVAGAIDESLEPRFRVVPEALFRARFASDRSHMRDAHGNWSALPPPWPPIRTPDATMTLMQFVDLATPGLGEVLDLPSLRARIRRT